MGPFYLDPTVITFKCHGYGTLGTFNLCKYCSDEAGSSHILLLSFSGWGRGSFLLIFMKLAPNSENIKLDFSIFSFVQFGRTICQKSSKFLLLFQNKKVFELKFNYNQFFNFEIEMLLFGDFLGLIFENLIFESKIF